MDGIFTLNRETNRLVPNDNPYEGDFYYNKSPHPIVFFVVKGTFEEEFDEYCLSKVDFGSTQHQWLVDDRVVVPFPDENGVYYEMIILSNAGDLSKKQCEWFADTLSMDTGLKDDEGFYFNDALYEMSEDGRGLYALGWYGAIEKCQTLWKEYNKDE